MTSVFLTIRVGLISHFYISNWHLIIVLIVLRGVRLNPYGEWALTILNFIFVSMKVVESTSIT